MLNIEELEAAINEELENETSESLSRWLLSKRGKLPQEDDFEDEFILMNRTSQIISKSPIIIGNECISSDRFFGPKYELAA